MTSNKSIRIEDYVFDYNARRTSIQRVFEKQLVSKAFLELKWTKHVPMGCDTSGKGHQGDISALDIDDGDEMLIFGSHIGSISITKYKYLLRGKFRKPISVNLKSHALKTLRWCPLDMRLFMVATTSGWMRVCDAAMEKEIQGKKFEGDVHFDWNEYNTTNSRVVVADGSASMKVIDFRVGMNLPQMIRWDEKPVDVVQWYPSKHHYLYAGRRDGTIGVFDIRSAREVLAEKKIHESRMYGLRITKDGLRVISADRSGLIHVADTWDFSTKGAFQEENPMTCHPEHFCPCLHVVNTPDLYVATNLNKLAVFRFLDGLPTPELHDVEARVLWNKPFVFRKSSYEIITGFQYNYLNILERSSQQEEESV